MSFRYENQEAIEDELGVVVRHNPVPMDSDIPSLQVVALPTRKRWSFAAPIETEQRPYQSKDGTRLRTFVIAVRLPARRLQPIAEELAALKRQEGIHFTPAEWIEVIRRGVFALQSGGGKFLEENPKLSVTVNT